MQFCLKKHMKDRSNPSLTNHMEEARRFYIPDRVHAQGTVSLSTLPRGHSAVILWNRGSGQTTYVYLCTDVYITCTYVSGTNVYMCVYACVNA